LHFTTAEVSRKPSLVQRLDSGTFLDRLLRLALHGLLGDLTPFVVLLFTAGDPDLELYNPVLGVQV
jgi:hypothetical protein